MALLAAAWVLLLLLVGAALAYAFLTYQPPEPELSLSPPLSFEEAPVAAPAPPAAEPSSPEEPESRPKAAPPAAEPLAEPQPQRTEPAPETAPAPETEREAGSGQMPEPEPAVEQPSAPEAEPGEAATRQQQQEQQAALPRIQPVPPPAPVEPAWRRFAMPYPGSSSLPRIAVVVTGLGLHDSLTRQAIDELPPGVTLSFSPYARGLETWLAQARARGHEVMLDLPMEPTSYPNSDPGHFGLFVANTAEQNLERLKEVLSRGSAYVGVAGVMGSRFTTEPEALRPVLTTLGDRGLLFLDNQASDASVAAELGRQLGVPTLYNDRTIDGEFVQASAIDSRLAQIERLARTKGAAVAMANVYPTTFQQLKTWAAGLKEKGLALAPVTALLDRQPPPH